MRIVLKSDWDTPVQPPDKKDENGYFIGREKEISFLTNELLRRNQGAILVSGHRGVGKTSLVYKALRNLKSKTILPVLINATHLEPEEAHESDVRAEGVGYAKQLLINLIRRLFSTSISAQDEGIINKKIYRKIEKLYLKAVAKKYESSGQTINAEEKRSEKENSYEVAFSTNVKELVTWLGGFSVSAAIIASPFPENLIGLKVILSLLFAGPAPLAFTKFVLSAKQTDTWGNALKSSAEELYTIDNNVGNLVFDLEEIHKDLAKNKIKVIYVIDELDKMENVSMGGPNLPGYTRIFKHFKNLFTLSSAIFIFIGGEEVFEYFTKSAKKDEGKNRSENYTYFSTKYFLSRPGESDLDRYLSEIVKEMPKPDSVEELKEFKEFKRFLIFSAQSDYFDLVQQIKDKITSFEDTNPIIELTKLQDLDYVKALLEKAVSVIYKDKYQAANPSRWWENESILRELYEHAYKLVELKAKSGLSDDKSDSLIGAAKRDMNYFLYRHQYFDLVSSNNENIGGTTIPIRTYRSKGLFITELPDKLDFKSEIEERFMKEMNAFIARVRYFGKLHDQFLSDDRYSMSLGVAETAAMVENISKWGVKFTQWNELSPIFKSLNQSPPPYPFDRDAIDNATQSAIQMQDTLNSNSAILLAGIIKDALSGGDYQTARLNQNENLFTGPLLQFRQEAEKVPHIVVFEKEFKRQILIAPSIPEDLIEKHINEIRENSNSHLILLTDSKANFWKAKRKGIIYFPLTEERDLSRKIGVIKNWLMPSPLETSQEQEDD